MVIFLSILAVIVLAIGVIGTFFGGPVVLLSGVIGSVLLVGLARVIELLTYIEENTRQGEPKRAWFCGPKNPSQNKS